MSKAYDPKQTQCEMLLEDLRGGFKITPIIALREYACMRLAARIWDLRADGHDIKERMKRVKTRRGHTMVSEYFMEGCNGT